MPLYHGMVGVGLNLLIFFNSSLLVGSVRRFDEKWELTSISALPFVTLLGLVSFCLFSFALWPIWSFLTLPLLFTLFMACMVTFPYILIVEVDVLSSFLILAILVLMMLDQEGLRSGIESMYALFLVDDKDEDALTKFKLVVAP